jgi:hypothetical protein
MYRSLLAAALLWAPLALAKPTLVYKPPPGDDEDKPVATEVTVTLQGTDIALKAVFNREPFGDACKNRCANASFFLDTDNNTGTGLQAGPKAAATGADLVITVQGAREYKETGSDPFLKVKVRALDASARTVEAGTTIVEMDNRREAERVQVEENTLYFLFDSTLADLPTAKEMRVIYQPPGRSAVKGVAKGMGGAIEGKGKKIQVLRAGTEEGKEK